MPTDVQICSKALVRLADQPISSFTDRAVGPVCKEIFPEVKLRVLTSGPWRFNTIKSQLLNRTTTEPPTQYQFTYELPTDMLTNLPRTVWDSPFNQGRSAPYIDWDMFEDGLLTNAEQILIDYPVDKDSITFPPHLTLLTIYAMAAELALIVTDQQSVATFWDRKAWGLPEERGKGGYFKEAQRIDSQGHPSQSIKSFILTDIRDGGI